MAKSKARKNRPADGKARTKQGKEARKAAQHAREQANKLLRAAGKPVPSEELWGDLKARMATKREALRLERNESSWRKMINAPKGLIRKS